MKNHNKLKFHIVIQLVLLCLLILFDRITKNLAAAHLKRGNDINILSNILVFHYTENTGAAFGIFKDRLWLFLVFSLLVLAAIIVAYILINRSAEKKLYSGTEQYSLKKINNMIFLNYLLVILAAGAVGNLIDRVINGYVVDFIYLKIINFPIFNFADICVSLSAVMLIIFFVFIYKDDPVKK